MQVGHRPVARIIRAPFAAGHWRALIGMALVYPLAELPGNLIRYLRRDGYFPRVCTVRTPQGQVKVRLEAPDDLLTVNEVFARADYKVGPELDVAVDIGANIGVASLYFLTRNPRARVYCIEPDPRNVRRLRETLSPYRGRWSLEEVAAALDDGEATFYVEPTGRYGGFQQGWKTNRITVTTRAVTTIIDEVLECEDRIDVLKIDVEGTEVDLVVALRPDQLDRIRTIYYETTRSTPLHTRRYQHRFANQVNTLTQV